MIQHFEVSTCNIIVIITLELVQLSEMLTHNYTHCTKVIINNQALNTKFCMLYSRWM